MTAPDFDDMSDEQMIQWLQDNDEGGRLQRELLAGSYGTQREVFARSRAATAGGCAVVAFLMLSPLVLAAGAARGML